MTQSIQCEYHTLLVDPLECYGWKRPVLIQGERCYYCLGAVVEAKEQGIDVIDDKRYD